MSLVARRWTASTDFWSPLYIGTQITLAHSRSGRTKFLYYFVPSDLINVGDQDTRF